MIPFEGDEKENRAVGEWECGAYRKGEGFGPFENENSIASASFPCQFLQLAECGCGPLDMNTFGLPAPVKACEPGDCPILCSDQPAYKDQLCDSFPGDLDWFTGAKKLNQVGVKLNYAPLFNLFTSYCDEGDTDCAENMVFELEVEPVPMKEAESASCDDDMELEEGGVAGVAVGSFVLGIFLGLALALLARRRGNQAATSAEPTPAALPAGKEDADDDSDENPKQDVTA